MKTPHTRREFLADVGRGMLMASVGVEVAQELGLARAFAGEVEPQRLTFGSKEGLVDLMQNTPVDRLLPKLVEQLRAGTSLRDLTAAAALANARTFGGEDYIGFHTMMALSPALQMSSELPKEMQALPVFKVLYRNTNRMQERGGKEHEVLHAVPVQPITGPRPTGEDLRAAVRKRDLAESEQLFARIAQGPGNESLDQLLYMVDDAAEVHRVVLPYRAWDMAGLIGHEHAHTLLRQSVHYCLQAEAWTGTTPTRGPRTLLPRLLEEHKLLGREPGTRRGEDKWVEELGMTIFRSTPESAAGAAAAALAEGFAPADVGVAITLAANQLLLRDMGRTPRDEVPGKPMGSVHGDSIGVHACDSANAWRNLSMASGSRNCFASLILGAFQVALDRGARGGDFLNWQPLPLAQHLVTIKVAEPEALLREAEEAIRGNLQAKASAVIHRYGELGHSERPVFDLLLRYAISEDGSLHGEKFYRTASEEFAAARTPHKWRQVVALTRVTASEYGRPAAGVAEARALLKV